MRTPCGRPHAWRILQWAAATAFLLFVAAMRAMEFRSVSKCANVPGYATASKGDIADGGPSRATETVLPSTDGRRGYVRQPVLFGHVHMAKTAGTNLNGELAHAFERVCGHKGYSYDAAATNRRFVAENATGVVRSMDSYGKSSPGYNRARVPHYIMREIGFDDCDWVSLEENWRGWVREFGNWSLPLELHVPCREPIDHLLSSCNYRRVEFKCRRDSGSSNGTETETASFLQEQVEKCETVVAKRYDEELERVDNFRIKCFDYSPISRYIEYMGDKLQWKRKPSLGYKRRDSNRSRNKTSECLLKEEHASIRETVRSYMLERWDYYKFCNSCIGTRDDLYSHPSKGSQDG